MKKLLILVVLLPALASAATVVNSFDAPDTGISSLAWDGSNLWALDGATQNVYRLDPNDGDVLSSFTVIDQSPNMLAGGIVHAGGFLYVTMYQGSSIGQAYKYDASGTFQSAFDFYC